jgi:hypothetical protein
LQIVGVGFESTLGSPLALDKDGKPLQPLYDDKGKPILDDRGNRLIPDLDPATGVQRTSPDGKLLFKPYRSHQVPTSDHRLVRGTIEMDQLYGKRAFTLNLIAGVGTLVSGFIPFYHAANAKANYSSFSSVLNGQFKEGFGIAAPDLTVSQLNRLENIVLHDGLTVMNNSQAKTIVFFPRHVVALSEDDRKIIDKGESMWPIIEKLGELIIVGKPIVTYRNREIVATRPQPSPASATTPNPTVPAPTVTGVRSPAGDLLAGNAPGSQITITGTNFVPGSQVTFGGVPVPAADVTFVTATQLDVKVPQGALSGPVKVTTPSGSAATQTDFVARPTIKGVDPKTGASPTAITITGSNLSGASSVKFGTVEQTAFITKEKDKLIVAVPNNAESGNVKVVTKEGQEATSADPFIAKPILNPLGTKQAGAGKTIEVTGKNLDNAQVYFGNARARILENDSTHVKVEVPENAVSDVLTLETPGYKDVKTPEKFTLIPRPTITDFSVNGGAKVTDASGKADDTLVINGQNFKDVSEVKFKDTRANITNNTDTQITVVVPDGLAKGKVDITITTPGGDVTSDKFSFTPKPTITGFSVNGAAATATASGKVGDTVIIVGKNLSGATEVKFGAIAATLSAANISDGQITLTVPTGVPVGTVNIEVTTPGGKGKSDKFTVTQ